MTDERDASPARSAATSGVPTTGLVLLNWNGWRDTVECLESLQRATGLDHQVIVADNGSDDGSIERIEAWARGDLAAGAPPGTAPGPKPVTVVEYTRDEAERGGLPEREAALVGLPPSRRLVLIRNGANLGFAGGTNVGLRYALARGYPYLGPLNNDTLVPPDALRRLVATLETHAAIGAVSPKILYADGSGRVFFAGGWVRLWRSGVGYVGHQQPDQVRFRGLQPTDFVSGACFVARRDFFLTTGLFDEEFFFGYEEIAHSRLARSRGLRPAMNLDVVVYHKHGASYGRREAFRLYHVVRGHLLLLRKYATPRERVLGSVCYGLILLKLCLRWTLTAETGLIAAVLRGLGDAWAGRPASP